MVGFNQMECSSQQFPIFRFTEDFAPPERHDRKKISSARRFGAAILHINNSKYGGSLIVTSEESPNIISIVGHGNVEYKVRMSMGRSGNSVIVARHSASNNGNNDDQISQPLP